MNSEQMQKVVELIATRLLARQGKELVLSQEELRHASVMALFLTHDSLCVNHTDLCFLRQLADGDQDHTAVAHLFEALSLGIQVKVTLNLNLHGVMPLKELARLPFTWRDEQGTPVVFRLAKVLSYRDIAQLSACWLVTSRKTLVTALAREALAAQHIRLVKQE